MNHNQQPTNHGPREDIIDKIARVFRLNACAQVVPEARGLEPKHSQSTNPFLLNIDVYPVTAEAAEWRASQESQVAVRPV